MTDESTGRAIGGKARAEKLSPERRREISRAASAAKAELAKLPKATHGREDHPLHIGNVEIPCYVLEDGRRVLAQRGMVAALGMSRGSSSKGGGDRLAHFVTGKALEPFVSADLKAVIETPIQFRTPTGNAANAYDAQILADICEAVLTARADGKLQKQQAHIAQQCEILMRGFARVGIIALVDEATGYQKDRARDALAKILEAYVTKELQPWIRTFDPDYYENMFRLRGLTYPPEKANYRPSYFGHLTNDIVYSRLAPGVLASLKEEAKKEQRKGTKLFQHLTAGFGRQELLKHLGLVMGLMKISSSWGEFMQNLNKVASRYNETMSLDLEEPDR